MKLEKDTEVKQKSGVGVPVKIFSFNESYIPPTYSYVKRGDFHFLSWGKDNLYPVFVLELFNNYGSPLNKAIINKKVKLSTGWGIKPIVDSTLNQWSKKNKLEHLFRYLSRDFEIFNGMCAEIIWSNDGSTFTMNYLPIHTIRIGLKENETDNDYFWYCSDWALFRKEEYTPQYIKKFDPNDRVGRQLLYYIDPNPSHTHLYPIMGYSNCINYIDLDYQIGVFHINQVRQGYSPSFILSFNGGIPTQDEQNDFYKNFVNNFKGSGGAGKILLSYAESKEQAPELIPVQLNDSDTRFILLQDQITNQISQSHECPVQLITTTPGKLGSSEERAALLNEFNTYYIPPRQEQLEYFVNSVLETIGFTEEIKLDDYVSNDKAGILTNNSEN